MKTGHGFGSVFAPQLEAYLAFKQAMGCYGASRIWYLRRFDAYCARHGRTVFDRDTVEGWVLEQLGRSGRYRSWMSYIRDVGRWLQAHGNADAYVLSDRWKAGVVPAHPYLLSTEQIEAFFTAAAHLHAQSPWRWQAVAFFTLMHSCGIRTGEARGLRTEQVDLPAGHLDIIWAKGNRSRRLPVTEQVVDVLAACDRTSRHRFPSRGTFFVSGAGNPVTAAAVGVVFNRIWDQAGLPRSASGPRPSPYAFRHHFAYANIERWMTQGKDAAAMLPYLSRYMGHAGFESTYYYVHTSPDFMRGYADLAAAGASLLPQVGFE
ncbi:MAG: tyrosine-type recombinase/integrase [Terracoccus sp.]